MTKICLTDIKHTVQMSREVNNSMTWEDGINIYYCSVMSLFTHSKIQVMYKRHFIYPYYKVQAACFHLILSFSSVKEEDSCHFKTQVTPFCLVVSVYDFCFKASSL